MFDFRIETFLTVCETLNYTKAAKKLNLTQPAVTQHIHHLEKEYGVVLFLIHGKQIKMSQEAKILQQTAMQFQNDEKMMKANFQKQKEDNRKPLLIGTTVTIGEFVLMKALSKFIKKHPEADVKVTITNTTELIQKLKHGDIQFAIVEGYFEQQEFDSMILKMDRFIPVCAKNYKFKRAVHQLRDLTDELLLIREPGSGTREIFENSIHIKNLPLNAFYRQMEINSMSAIVQLLLEKSGVSFLYEAAVRKELQANTLQEIELEDYQNILHEFSFIWNKGSIYGENYIAVCNELKKYTTEWDRSK